MRTNPTFDPRIQPVGVYMNQPPGRYVQPVVQQHNMTMQPSFTGMPVLNQQTPYQVPHPMPLHHTQYNEQPRAAQRTEGAPAGAGEVNKPTSVPTNIKMVNDSGELLRGQEMQGFEHMDGDGEEQYDEDYGHDEEEEQEEDIKNQQIIMFWEHKFYTILERFQLIFEKVDLIRTEFYNLNTELKNVDSEEQWNEAKDHHQDFMEQLEQFSEELAGVIKENANLVEQNENEDNQHNIWKVRYFELFEGYKAMESEFNEIKDAKGEDAKVNELMANYTELSREYSQVASQLAELKQKGGKGIESSPDKIYREKLDIAIRQAEKYKDTLDQVHKSNEQMAGMIEELKMQKNNLEAMLENEQSNNHQQNYEDFNRAIAERDQQIGLLNKELKDLSEKYNLLVETHNSMFNRIQEEEPRIKSKFIQMEQQISSKNMENMQLRSKLLEAELKEKTTSSVSDEYQKILKIRTAEVQERDLELQRLRKEYNQLQNSRRNESEKDLTLIKKDYEGRVKKLQSEFDDKIDELKKKLRKKEEEGENSTLMGIKLESLEKKNRILLQEIEGLSNDLNSRERQSMELKRMSTIQEKYKQLESQYNIVVDEKEQLGATLNQKNFEVETLQTQINEFQSRISTLSQTTSNSTSKPLLNEIEELNRLVQIKENEIKKLKANLILKEGTIKEVERETELAKAALSANEKANSREKEALGDTIRSLERKNQENQKKMRELEFQYGSIMKKNLEEEIKNLRYQNQQKQQNILRLESDQLELRSRLSHYERVRSTHSADINQLTSRIKQLQSAKYDMIKKVENSFRDVKNKEKQNRELLDSLKNTKENVTKLQLRLSENEKVIGEKDKIIESIEGQLMVSNSRLAYISEEYENLRLRRRDETDTILKQSDDLRRKVLEYENLTDTKKELKERFSSEIVKIENEMIQQLKEEKEFLKSQLAVALQQIGNLPVQDKNRSARKSKASEGIENIQKRLFDFNNRLDDIINKNKQLNRGFGSNVENSRVSSHQRSTKEADDQIKILKHEVQELRKYISKLEVESAGETIKLNPKNELIYQEQEKIFTERVDFYQNQTNELEARIQNLIKVNTNLKERIESLLKDKGNSSSVEFYKSQLAISEDTVNSLQTKISKLMEQNRSLKANSNENNTKVCREYEDKLFQCENRIFMLQRKLSSLELEKNRSQNSKLDLQRNLNLVQNELQSLKYSSDKQVESYKSNARSLTDQILKFETESNEMLQKIRQLESQNNRLSQAMHSSYSQQHIFFNTPVKDSTPKPSPGKR